MRATAAAPRQLAKPIDTTLCDPPSLGLSGPGDSYSQKPPRNQIESSSPAVMLFQRNYSALKYKVDFPVCGHHSLGFSHYQSVRRGQ
jgi:hypothetical protein